MHPIVSHEIAHIHRQDLMAAAEHDRLVSRVRRTRRTRNAMHTLRRVLGSAIPTAGAARPHGVAMTVAQARDAN